MPTTIPPAHVTDEAQRSGSTPSTDAIDERVQASHTGSRITKRPAFSTGLGFVGGFWVAVGGWAVVCGVLIAASYRQLAGIGGFWDDRLTLGAEHSLGAWWSGGLLLTAGLLALATAEATRSLPAEPAARRRLARAFRVLGFWLAVLCIDEWASLHERYDWSDIVIPRELRLPPIALAMAATVGWAFWTMWRQRGALGSGLATFLIAAGFGSMGSIYGIELAEHAVVWPEGWRPARLAFEEGLELFGMGLVLFAVAWHWIGQASTPARRADTVARAAVVAGVGLLCVAPLLILLQHLMPLEGKWARMGVPGKAVPPMLLLVAAATAWFAFLRGGEGRRIWLVAAIVALLACVEAMTSLSAWFVEVPVNRMRMDFVLLAAGVGIAAIGLIAKRGLWVAAGLVAVALNAIGFVAFKNPVMQLAATLGAGVLLAALAWSATARGGATGSPTKPEPAAR
ncbi:MAG: hypothetical protein AAGE65_08705 [Planctomycetota bacterium]